MQNLMKMIMALAVVLGMGLISGEAIAQAGANGGGLGTWGSVPGGANAGDGALLSSIDDTAKNTAIRMKSIVYGGSAMGALALGVLAFFGRFQWVWFFGLIGGLVLIAGINLGIQYLTGDQDALTTTLAEDQQFVQ